MRSEPSDSVSAWNDQLLGADPRLTGGPSLVIRTHDPGKPRVGLADGEIVSYLEPIRFDPLHDPTIGERLTQLHLGHTSRSVFAGDLLGEAQEVDNTVGPDDLGETGDVCRAIGVDKRVEKT